jgi:hypothetical protein
MPFELLGSETLLKGRAFLIRRDHLRTPDGRETKFDIIEHGGSVVIVPVDQDGNLLFVRQYRHAAGVDLLELPAGTLEENENPAVCAAREIREETGFAANCNLRRSGLRRDNGRSGLRPDNGSAVLPDRRLTAGPESRSPLSGLKARPPVTPGR